MLITAAYFGNFDQDDTSADLATGEVCIANISPLERKKRLVFGISQLVTTLMILVVLVLLHINSLCGCP